MCCLLYQETFHMVIHILVTSQRDYCNTIHMRQPLKSIWKLQLAWNAMAPVLHLCYTSCISIPELGAIQSAGSYLQVRSIKEFHLCSFWSWHLPSGIPYHLRWDWHDSVSLLESAEGLAVSPGRKVRKLVKPEWFDIILWCFFFYSHLLLWIVCCML